MVEKSLQFLMTEPKCHNILNFLQVVNFQIQEIKELRDIFLGLVNLIPSVWLSNAFAEVVIVAQSKKEQLLFVLLLHLEAEDPRSAIVFGFLGQIYLVE